MITLPIYYTFKVKRKYETILVGLNKYERLHYIPRNNMKKYYYQLIRSKISTIKPIKGTFAIHYSLYYKNKISDAPNIIAVIDKILLDALQEYKKIENDNVQFYIGSSWEVVEQDRDNPRVEIVVSNISYIK